MSKSRYMPKDDATKALWLNNFSATLPGYSTALGLSAADIASVAADAAFFNYVLNSQQQMLAHAQQWTAYKLSARNGPGASLGSAPVAPNLGSAPPAVAPDIFGRATALVARIKTAPGYNDAIGQALQIIGAEHTVDMNSMKPALTAGTNAGQVVVLWKKHEMDSLELWVDRGGGFAFLAIDTVPDYTDTQPFPASGQSAVWKYKGIYRVADERTGQWSDIVTIAVAG
jgi:hypothetical protein